MRFLVAILIFSIIILFHELGHFLFAKRAGIKVNEFCLGLGPTIWGVQKGETFYCIKALPFGGACMMEGEDGEIDGSETSFQSKTVWQRISVVAAGPVFNFIMAFIFSFIILMCVGYDVPVITDIMEGYPAESAGLEAGDVIKSINGKSIHFYREVSNYLVFHSGSESLDIVYVRDGEVYETTIIPEYSEEENRYLIGIYNDYSRVKVNVLSGLKYAAFEVKYWVDTTFMSLRMLVMRQVSLNDVSGPVGIVKTIGDTYSESASQGFFYVFINMLNITILLSANLGVMNLLPLPALDGGRLVFLIIEAIRGKRIPPEKEGLVHGIGIVLLMLLMVVIMFNDIRNIVIN
ncbi:MAG: RIP metalloprotease RseP [Lachnospiraceae bacterium]|nr:RIP metalloprotease RseP [Lachnospiraceae bacterium]